MSVVMFLIGAIGLWGGLALAIINYLRKDKAARERAKASGTPDDTSDPS